MSSKISVYFMNISTLTTTILLSLLLASGTPTAQADSVNSPNITLNADTNRTGGVGAGNVSVVINTITVAETTLPEYSSGSGKAITLSARPGYQFDPSSNVTAQSATFGINGGAVNAVASITPTGAANETLTFNLTSGGNPNAQDIIRFNGARIRILTAAGAAGPAQTTMQVTTSSAGGAFNNQGIVAANITRGAPDRLVFSTQPGNNQANADLLPQVKVVDFGGNTITNDSRSILLSLSTNPGNATLEGNTQVTGVSGVAAWTAGDDLRITTAASGYVLQAAHNGTALASSNIAQSQPFTISAGNPGRLSIGTQPVNTSAGGDILVTVRVEDEFGNLAPTPAIDVSLEAAVNPLGWPLLVDTSLTKTSVDGIASWGVADHLRILKAVSGYQLAASGLGAPVTTDSFEIVSGGAALVRFVTDPSNVAVGTVMEPAPSVEVTDILGNRVTNSTEVTLSTAPARCATTLEGNEADTVSGLATFEALVSSTACESMSLIAEVPGLVGARSDEFDVKAANSVPVAITSMKIVENRLLRFSAQGNFSLSSREIDNPTLRGGRLTVTGETGDATYNLPRAGWQRRGGGGFRFRGAKCRNVTVRRNSLAVNCRGRTGTITIPESGPVHAVLSIGRGTAELCGSCGGTIIGDEDESFERASCSTPSICP